MVKNIAQSIFKYPPSYVNCLLIDHLRDIINEIFNEQIEATMSYYQVYLKTQMSNLKKLAQFPFLSWAASVKRKRL